MSPQEQARQRVRNEFGNTVAQKASEAFCELYGGDMGAGLESLGISPGVGPSRLPTVLELEQDAPPTAMESMGPDAMRQAQEAAAEVLRQLGEEHAALHARTALRRRTIERRRDTFLLEAGAVLDELGRASGGPLGPLSESVTLQAPPSQIVEACWLNGTVRTAADARTVATVADDPRIRFIDVPRRLFKEIGSTAALVGAPAFRAANGVSGQGVNVAVIDSEVSRQHLAFGTRVIHKANFTKEPFGNPDGHGTAVAGIIGSMNSPLTGVAPDVTVFNYKVLATVNALNADDFGGALAIQQALEDGIHVANCSWGAGLATNGTSREARACNAAWALGLIIVKSAGNRGPGASTLTTPADADGIIVVGATDRSGQAVQSYSSRGPFTDVNGNLVSRPHLVAPGGSDADQMTSCVTSGGFGFCGAGTSFAAPHVTGLIALLLCVDPTMTPDQIRAHLIGRCTPLAGTSPAIQGSGLLRL
jgi:serine protease AprX